MTSACGARNALGFVSRALWGNGGHEVSSESGTSDGVTVDDIPADGIAAAMESDPVEDVDSSESLIGQMLPGLFGEMSSSMGNDLIDDFTGEGSINDGTAVEGVVLYDEDWRDVTDALSFPLGSM